MMYGACIMCLFVCRCLLNLTKFHIYHVSMFVQQHNKAILGMMYAIYMYIRRIVHNALCICV